MTLTRTARRFVSATLPDALGAVIATAARLADRGFDRVGLAPQKLEIPDGVVCELHDFFGGTIDPNAVVIRRGHWPGINHPRAFALPGLIYLGADRGIDPGPPPRATLILVHELVHTWQGLRVGPRYIVRALFEQVRWGQRAYDWREHVAAAAGTALPWSLALPAEAYAQLIAEAYATRTRASLAEVSGSEGNEAAVICAVFTELRGGMGV